jgi:hypothetical protein
MQTTSGTQGRKCDSPIGLLKNSKKKSWKHVGPIFLKFICTLKIIIVTWQSGSRIAVQLFIKSIQRFAFNYSSYTERRLK